jgi:hypothetical protein
VRFYLKETIDPGNEAMFVDVLDAPLALARRVQLLHTHRILLIQTNPAFLRLYWSIEINGDIGFNRIVEKRRLLYGH